MEWIRADFCLLTKVSSMSLTEGKQRSNARLALQTRRMLLSLLRYVQIEWLCNL